MFALRLASRRRSTHPLRSIGSALAEVSAQSPDAPVEDVADELRAALDRRGCDVHPYQVSRWALQIVAGETPRVDLAS